jgi:hypothetical protein
LPHSTPTFLNSSSILSSNLHLHLFILKFLNPPFLWILHFFYMCTCLIYIFILDLTILGVLLDTVKHLWKSRSSLILMETLTLPLKKTIISLYWLCCLLFFEEINDSFQSVQHSENQDQVQCGNHYCRLSFNKIRLTLWNVIQNSTQTSKSFG